MVKNKKLSSLLLKPIFIAVMTLYILSTAALVSGLPDTLPVKWASTPLTLDYLLSFLMPIVAFVIGYYATKNKNNWSRLFDGSVFLVCYWWLQTFFMGVGIYLVSSSTSNESALINIVIADVTPIILLACYGAYERKKKNSHDTIGVQWGFMALVLIAVVATILLQLASIASALSQSTFTFNGPSMITTLAPVIFVIFVTIGYYLLGRIKERLYRPYLAIIAGTIYLFSAYAWVYFFGSMPSETWLIVAGNIASLISAFTLLYYIKSSTK